MLLSLFDVLRDFSLTYVSMKICGHVVKGTSVERKEPLMDAALFPSVYMCWLILHYSIFPNKICQSENHSFSYFTNVY